MQDQKAQSSKTDRSADSQTFAKTLSLFFRPWKPLGFGAFVTHAILPPTSLGLEIFKEWREFSREGAEAIQGNMSAAAEGLHQLAKCKTPAEIGEVAPHVARSVTSHWLQANQKLAGLAIEYACARMEKADKWALSTFKRADG